jgi:hypothetical protein
MKLRRPRRRPSAALVAAGALLASLSLTATSVHPAAASGGAFTCTPGFFQVLSGQLNKLNPVTGVYTPIGSAYTDTYNAMGYDTLDNYLYAIDTGTGKGDLLRIASDGSVTNLGTPTGYPSGLSSVAGDFDGSGDLIVQDTDKIYYSIDVATMSATQLNITGSVASVDDLVWINGYMYGLTGTTTVELLVVNLTTKVAAEYPVTGMTSTDGAFGAGFSDQPNDLFFSDNSGQGIYSLSGYTTTTPSATKVATGAVTGNNDGAACKLAGSPFAGPTANADSYTLLAGQTYTVDAAEGVLTNDTGSEPLSVDSHTNPSQGSLTLNSDGSFSYTPTGEYSGPDSFTYVAEDPYGRISSAATVSLTVLPDPQDQTYTTDLDTAYSLSAPGLLTGAVGSALTITSNTNPVHGTVSVGSNGAFTYTPPTNWSGAATFTYTVTDAAAQTATATVTVDVLPSVQPDSYTADGSTPLTVSAPGVLANDVGTALTVTSNTTPGHGAVIVHANGSLTYTAAAGFSGTDSFQYTASDSSSLTGTATVTIQVTPAAGSPSYTTPAGTTLDVAAAQGVVAASDGSGLTAAETSGTSHGSLSLNADGSFTYTPNAGYSGDDSFGFQVTDSHTQQSSGTASIVVTPIAAADSGTTPYRTELSVTAPGVLGNDVGTGLTVISNTTPGHGTATVSADGAYVYTPAIGFVGTDTFQYTLKDQAGSTASATVTITVSQISTSFTAAPDPASTSYGNSVTLTASGLPSNATGTVTFTAGGSTLCTTGQLSAGSASCSTAVLVPGGYSVTGTYSGDVGYLTSTASTSFTIDQASTSFTASADPTSTSYGNTVDLSASGLPSSASGTVTFTAGGSTLCTTGQLSSGSASCTTAVLPVTSYSVTATYPGDANYQGSTASTSFIITKAPTSFTASADPTSTSYGNTVQLSAAGLPAGAAGTVTFSAGGSTLCVTGQLSSGTASCTTALIVPAGYSVTATYSGDANYQGSTASTGFTITKAATSFTAVADPTSTSYGNTVQLSASGLPTDATGTVTFSAGGSTLCVTGQLSSGAASCTTALLVPAGYAVTATYSGDSNYQGSTAASSFTITKLATSFTASADPASTSGGNTVDLSASGLPSGATGTVTFSAGGSTLCVTGQLSAGNASCATAALAPAGYSVTATYAGDSDYQGSTATTAFTVTADPQLQLSTSGTPVAAATGSAYELTLISSLGGSPAGPAYADPVLTATLPAGESFAAAPSATGWDCALSAGDTVLTCDSTLAPISAGTSLADVVATVDIASTGSLETTASLADAADLAITATATATVDVTATPVLEIATLGTPAGAVAGTAYDLTVNSSLGAALAGPAYDDPTLFITLPGGETFAAAPTPSGWSCSLNLSATILTCASIEAPIAAGSALADVTATVDISASASGSLQTSAALADAGDGATTVSATATVDVTGPPVLAVSTSGTPSKEVVGSTYTLTISSSLGDAPAGPADHDPVLTATLPAGETFTAAPSPAGWSCALSAGDTVLTCTSTLAPIPAGTSFADVTATVDIAATGSLETAVSLTDAADLATAATASATVDAIVAPVLELSTSGTPSGATVGTSYILTLISSLGGSPAGAADHDPILTATLPGGETFAAAPSPAGWSCALSAGDTVLTCTSTLAPIAAGTSLADVTATVDIASTGSLETVASLTDAADLATTATASATVDASAVPVLVVSTSGTPATTPEGGSYTLQVTVTLSPSGGPAYSEPSVTVVLPSGETFAASTTAAGWSCSLSDGATKLTCVRTGATPVDPGATLLSLGIPVQVGTTASGVLSTSVSASDSGDGAAPAAGGAATTVPVETPDTGAPAGASSPSWLGALLAAAGLLVIVEESRRRRFARPA